MGECRGKREITQLRQMGWGRMFIYVYGRPWPEEPWGLDNGAFGCWKRGETFPEDDYRRRLERALRLPTRPLLAVLPDVVAGGLRSLEYSLRWHGELHGTGLPWYLAVQDGMPPAAVEPLMPLFAGLFLGGDDAFKLTAPVWSDMAHRHGKRFHFARCGTPRKLAFARRVGADSADSAFPFWAMNSKQPGRSRNLEKFCAHWLDGDPQMELGL